MRLAYIIFLAFLFILELGCDSDTPIVMQPPPDPEILIAHNKWRSRIGVADLEWSEDLAKKAMALLDGSTCVWTDNTEGLGQNSSTINFAGAPPTPESVIDVWALSFQDYIYEIDSCTLSSCDFYKQIVWANSIALGCATATCILQGLVVWVCLYDPPGNIPGEKP